MSAELEQLRKQYEVFQSKLKRMDNPMQRVDQMKDELAGLAASATSPSGKVTVVAGPGGAIRDVQFTEDAVRQPAAALAAEVKSTLQQAVAAAARRQARIVDEHMGGQLNAYDRVLQNQADAFGTTVDELKDSIGDVPQPAKPGRSDDDDFSEGTLMSKGYKPPPPTGPSAGGPPAGGSGTAADKFLKNLFDEDGR